MGRNVCAGIQYLSQVRGTALADFVVLVCARARLLHGGVYTGKGDQLLRLLETRKITNLSQNDNGSILADSGDAKTTRILFYVLYIVVSLIFSAIFIALISAQDTPEEANRFRMYFVGVVAFLIYESVQSITSFRKQDQQREKERTKKQREKD